MKNIAIWKSKLFILVFVFLFIIPIISDAQSPAGIANGNQGFEQNSSVINGGFGYSKIGDQDYLGFRFQPEIAIGKVGFGLDIPLLFNIEDGDIRTDEFKGGVGALRLLRYVRYGRKKQDPVHVKVGDLTGSYIGFGMLVNNYSNSTSWEKRKIGVSWDVLIKNRFGIEGLYSDFDASSLNLLALRPYFKPLGHTNIPILKTMEIGGTFVIDKDQTTLPDTTRYVFTEEGMSAYSADIGMFFLNTSFIDLTGFAQFGVLGKNKVLEDFSHDYKSGNGKSVGLAARMNIIGNVFSLSTRIERLWYSDYFQPQFFDVMYEINKDAKIMSLTSSKEMQGIYGSLYANVIDRILVGGGLLLPDDISETNPAFLHIDAEAPNLIPKIILSAHYVKGNIADLSNAFEIDENSLATARIAYKILPVLVAGVDIRWTFMVLEDGSYDADKTVMPYVGLHIPLNF